MRDRIDQQKANAAYGHTRFQWLNGTLLNGTVPPMFGRPEGPRANAPTLSEALRRSANDLRDRVGPIQDEFDRESPDVTPVGDGAFEVEASCPLDRLAEAVGIEIPETDAETAGGLILDLLGRLARAGDSVEVGRHRLIVTQADPTRIRRVRVEPLPEPEPAEDPDEA